MSKFDSLRKKYDDFSTPAWRVIAGKSELSGKDYEIYDISVDLSVGDLCDACCFKLGGVYEPPARKINPSALEKLKPGTKLKIYLGYGSSLSEVFSGYVSELKLIYNEEEIALAVYGLDARSLMAISTRRKIYKDKKINDAAKEILKDYSELIGSPACSLPPLEGDAPITQAGSDLDFLMAAAERSGLLVYMDCGKFIIGKPQNKICAELDWEQFRMEFSIEYLDIKINGTGSNNTENKRFSASAPAKQRAKQESLISCIQEYGLPSYYSGESGEKIMANIGAARAASALNGKIVSNGIPEAKPGYRLKINRFPLGPLKTGSEFLVFGVSHSINRIHGFVSEIFIKGLEN